MSYTIYVLPEDQMTITGAVLDGVTQGDGSHMVGATITLNSNAWVPVEINDAGETPGAENFGDSDAGQTLVNSLTIDGRTYGPGTVAEAEYSLQATAGGQTYQLIAFNVRGGPGPAYGTVEGLAFIGPPGGFPPIGVPLSVTQAAEGPNIPVADYATPVCFVTGTEIAVPGGTCAVEDLRPGDLVFTRDHGPQPVRWIGMRTQAAIGDAAPVLFEPGAIGNSRPLSVSRQHRIRAGGWKAELLFGEEDVLIPAIHFVNGRDIRSVEGGTVTYVHLLFDQHEIVFAEGVEAESFHPAAENLDRLSEAARAELLALFPAIAQGRYGPSAYRTLKSPEARALLAA